MTKIQELFDMICLATGKMEEKKENFEYYACFSCLLGQTLVFLFWVKLFFSSFIFPPFFPWVSNREYYVTQSLVYFLFLHFPSDQTEDSYLLRYNRKMGTGFLLM